MSTQVVVPELPSCDFCADIGVSRPARYDGATRMGPWANMCEEHFRQYGVGLGTGRGQKLIPKDELSGFAGLTVAELKRRLQPGVRLRLIHSLLGPCDKARVVVCSNSVSVQFAGDGIAEGRCSFLYWPKARDLRETSSGFMILEGGQVAAQYVWEHPFESRS